MYHKSLDYYNWLMEKVQNTDEFHRKALMVPFLDTAIKISMQIADGSSNPKSDFIEYLKYAKGLVRQCVVFTSAASQNGIFSEEDVNFSIESLMEMTKMLGAMIVSFQRSINSRKSENHKHRESKHDNADEFSTNELEYNF